MASSIAFLIFNNSHIKTAKISITWYYSLTESHKKTILGDTECL